MTKICKVKIYDMRLSSFALRTMMKRVKKLPPKHRTIQKTIKRNFNRRIVCPHFSKTLNKSIKAV